MADASSIFKSEFKQYSSSLKETSYDIDNEEYLCQDSTKIVYNFDSIVKAKYPSKQPASYDTLLIDKNNVYCIEFKNQKYSDIKNEEIKKKLVNGYDVLTEIFAENNIQKTNYKFIFCVAYKNNDTKWRSGITKNFIQFKLEQYKGKYFDEIYTNDVQYFTNEYKKYFYKQLKCL